MNKRKAFSERITTPIGNYFHGTHFLSVVMDIHFEIRKARTSEEKDLVSYHKIKLGPQTTTFTSDQRLWVWDKPNYRLFVGNNKGICIEVDEGATKEKAAQALKDYVKDMQIPIDVDSYINKKSKLGI